MGHKKVRATLDCVRPWLEKTIRKKIKIKTNSLSFSEYFKFIENHAKS